MPRPSDLYATLGAPGLYQATPCTPFRLPNVYVFPPEEDDQDAYCLFHAGSALPAAFEPLYRHSVYTQRGGPNSPTFTDLRALDHALSYFQPTALCNARHGPRSSWEGEERIQGTTPRTFSTLTVSSAADAETHIRSNASYQVEAKGGHEERPWLEDSTPASRRSSVFGDRNYDISDCRPRGGEDQAASKQAQTMTLRSRTAMALKGLGNAMTRRLEAGAPASEGRKHADPVAHDSWFDPSEGLRRKRSRRTLGRLFGSRSNVDIHSMSEASVNDDAAEVSPPPPPPSSGWDPSLNRRKSMTQLFSLPRKSAGIKANTAHSRLDDPAATTHESRKSVTQFFAMGQGAGLSSRTVVPVDADESSTIARGSSYAESLVSLPTSGTTAPLPSRRKSFLGRRSFSFLDLHRRFTTDSGSRPPQTSQTHQHTSPPAPAMDSTVPFSPDSLSERTSSSSIAVSTEYEQTIEDEMRFPESHVEVVHIPAIIREGGRALVKDLEPSLVSGVRLDLSEDSSFTSSFGLGIPDEDDVESEAGEGHPTMELAVRLDSLNFDQLMFDPESFTGAIYD